MNKKQKVKIGDVVIVKHQSPIDHFHYLCGIITGVYLNGFSFKEFGYDKTEHEFLDNNIEVVAVISILTNIYE